MPAVVHDVPLKAAERWMRSPSRSPEEENREARVAEGGRKSLNGTVTYNQERWTEPDSIGFRFLRRKGRAYASSIRSGGIPVCFGGGACVLANELQSELRSR